MKLLLVSGSYPPEYCGVGDYSAKLAEALIKQGVEVEVLANIDWSIKQYWKILKRIANAKANIIHIQFPAVGFGYGIMPQLLALKYKLFVTIHEVSNFHPIRRFWLLPFSLNANLIFTSSFELKYFKSLFFWNNKPAVVIPIGPNIKAGNNLHLPFTEKKVTQIVYFGAVRPNKGIEQVIKLANLIKTNGLAYEVKIIGNVIKSNLSYYNNVKEQTRDLPVQWVINLSEQDVSDEISKHVLSYLPFPDGASERRGSLLAVLKNNLLTFTTKGPHTPTALNDVVNFVSNPEEMFNQLVYLDINKLKLALDSKKNKMEEYMASFEWDEIAKKHCHFYSDYK